MIEELYFRLLTIRSFLLPDILVYHAKNYIHHPILRIPSLCIPSSWLCMSIKQDSVTFSYFAPKLNIPTSEMLPEFSFDVTFTII